ncbi:MAG TPA: DEAD/DEAH box helicase [Isosphaeraceae bacterium]|nr:DEAD/DEAH box helicase [Isosphaeraceae bacterium]
MDALTVDALPVEQTEACKTLLGRWGRRSSKIPAELLVRQVMACVPATEWPTRVAALDAVIRRLEAAKRDGLRIASGPEKGAALGPYLTKRKGSESRPYHTLLQGVDPILGRCDCPDFLRNSLGLCKHLLVVLDGVYAKPNRLKLAIKEQAKLAQWPASGLRWDPVRPLRGAGDWLDRVSWLEIPESNGRRAAMAPAISKLFKHSGDGIWVLKQAFPENPDRRLALVEELLGLVPANARSVRHDPALRALLSGERKRLKHLEEAALERSQWKAALKSLKRPLYAYQREGVARFVSAGRLLLADDMGLGKTAQAIACCNMLRRAGKVKRGLIIAPAALKPQWAREWCVFSDMPIDVVDGSPPERHAMYDARKEGFLIINYEQLLRDLDKIKDWDPDLVVLDEAQRIKNWATKTALSVKGLNPPFRLVLTGTPMENRIEELASIVEWVDEMALEPKWRLGALHSVYADGRKEITGVRDLDTLRERLRPCMLRRVRQEVLDQLPPRTDTRVPVELTAEQAEEHDALRQPIASIMQRAASRPLTQAEFLHLMSLLTSQRIISNGLAQLNFEHIWPSIRTQKPEESTIKGLFAPKLLELRQLVRNVVLEQERKVVVFSQWRRMLTLAHWVISDLLAENGLYAGFFTGAEGQRRRTQNIVEFHDHPNFRLLFTSDAGGVGLNLQRASNCVINMEMPWNPAVLEQRIGRVYRLGQEKPIDVFNLVCETGIEARIASLVGNKQAFFKGLFDGDSDSVHFEQSGSFLSKIEKLFEPGEIAALAASGGAADADEDDLAELGLDDEVADPFDALVEAADESRDLVTAAGANGNGAAHEAEPQERAEKRAGARAKAESAMPAAGEVRRLFSQLEIRRAPSGKVVIEASDDAASALSALFEGMAALLQSAGQTQD